MKAIWLIFVTLAAGIVGGTFFGLFNLAVAEPYIDKAIGFEVQGEVNAGHPVDQAQLGDYRGWQKGGEVVSAVILGMALSSILGIVFAYGRKALPSQNNVKKALVLAGIIWFVLFFVTALKYPPNPPAVDALNTSIYYRQALYVAFLSISGGALLGSVAISRRIKLRRNSGFRSTFLIAITYASIVVASYFALPPNGYVVTENMKDLVFSFRIVSTISMALFWTITGLTFGILWEKFKPNLETPQRLTNF